MKSVTAAIIWGGGKVLLARRDANQKLPGYWEFPGGKVEPGESLQECLIRELREELGVEAQAGKVFCESYHVHEHGAFKIFAIEATIDSLSFDLKAHDQIEWVEPKDLHKFQLLPADVAIGARLATEKMND